MAVSERKARSEVLLRRGKVMLKGNRTEEQSELLETGKLGEERA